MYNVINIIIDKTISKENSLTIIKEIEKLGKEKFLYEKIEEKDLEKKTNPENLRLNISYEGKKKAYNFSDRNYKVALCNSIVEILYDKVFKDNKFVSIKGVDDIGYPHDFINKKHWPQNAYMWPGDGAIDHLIEIKIKEDTIDMFPKIN